MTVTDDLVDAAIEIHTQWSLALRGIKMRERFPSIGFDGTREVYAVADEVIQTHRKVRRVPPALCRST